MNDHKLQLELIKKIVSTKVQGVPLLVAGGSVIDSFLGLTCNDIDIFVPRYNIESIGIALNEMLSQWGIVIGSFEESGVKILESEYGSHSLVYEVLGSYKTSPVKLQFIAVENVHTSVSSNFASFITQVLAAFSVSITKVGMFLGSDGLLHYCSHFKALSTIGDKACLDTIAFVEGSEALLAKCVTKYISYCKSPFQRTEKNSFLFIHSSYKCFTILPSGTVRQNTDSLYYLLDDEGINGVQTFDHSGDKIKAIRSTEESVPDVSAFFDAFRSSTRPRPQDRSSQSSLTPELQPDRGETRGVTPSRWNAGSTGGSFSGLNAYVEYGEAPPFPAPRPSDNF